MRFDEDAYSEDPVYEEMAQRSDFAPPCHPDQGFPDHRLWHSYQDRYPVEFARILAKKREYSATPKWWHEEWRKVEMAELQFIIEQACELKEFLTTSPTREEFIARRDNQKG